MTVLRKLNRSRLLQGRIVVPKVAALTTLNDLPKSKKVELKRQAE